MPDEMTLTNIDLIKASPWQSRSTMDLIKLEELQVDIFTNRLHQPIVLRPVKGDYTDADDPDSWTTVICEIVSGHRRLEAFLDLHRRGWELYGHSPGPSVSEYWDGEITRIPSIVRDMTDAEAVRTILSENRMREDVNVMDEIRAVRRALDSINVKHQELAISLGISEPQLSNRLRILKLPEGLQDCVAASKLRWTTARELLSFVGTECDHSKELAFIERKVQDNEGAMPFRMLQQLMAAAREDNKNEWRRLTGPFEYWMTDEDPLFDVEEFTNDYKPRTHTLPADSSQNSGTRLYTCAVDEFDRLQEDGRRGVLEFEAPEAGDGSAPSGDYARGFRAPAGNDAPDAHQAALRDNAGSPSRDKQPDEVLRQELGRPSGSESAKRERWDEAIKHMYSRMVPVVEVMDDGTVDRLLGGSSETEVTLMTWLETIPGRYDELDWLHGWHLDELSDVFGLDFHAIQFDRSSGPMRWAVRVATLDEASKRALLRLTLAATSAACIGRCGSSVTVEPHFCLQCSATLLGHGDNPTSLQEVSSRS